jgi:hypothetical protein
MAEGADFPCCGEKIAAQREREHGDGGEAGVLQQLAEGEAKVVHGSVVGGQWSVVSCLIPHSALRIPHLNNGSG